MDLRLRKRSSLSNKTILIGIAFFILTIMGIGFSYLESRLNINGNITIVNGLWDVHFENLAVTSGSVTAITPAKINSDRRKVTFAVKLSNQTDFYQFEVDVVNSGELDAMVGNAQIKGLPDSLKEFIDCTLIYADDTPIEATDKLLKGTRQRLKAKVKFNDKIDLSKLPVSETFDLVLEIPYVQITDDAKDKTTGTSLYNKIKEDINDSSKYARKYFGATDTFLGNQDIYYYYGAAVNNNVIFGNYCWKIVRTTDTGGVKLLYSGVPSAEGTCNNKSNDLSLTKDMMGTTNAYTVFNSSGDSLSDIGYMYNTRYEFHSRDLYANGRYVTAKFGKSFTYNKITDEYTLTDTVYEKVDTNILKDYRYTCWNALDSCRAVSYVFFYNSSDAYYINLTSGKSIEDAINEMLYNNVNVKNSTIKEVIDYWYSNNMTQYTKYLEDTYWCNDRSTANLSASGWNSKEGNITSSLEFRSKANKIDLTCPNKNDRFTTEESNGNGVLEFPVGLLTETEIYLSYVDIKSPLLSSGNSYWTMSPASVGYGSMHNFYAYNYNSLYLDSATSSVNYSSNSIGVRPSVSLRAGIQYSDGDGSVDKPYIIIMV